MPVTEGAFFCANAVNIFIFIRIITVIPLGKNWELRSHVVPCFYLEEREKATYCFLLMCFWRGFLLWIIHLFYNEHGWTEQSLVLVDNLHSCCVTPGTCRFRVFAVQCQKSFLPRTKLLSLLSHQLSNQSLQGMKISSHLLFPWENTGMWHQGIKAMFWGLPNLWELVPCITSLLPSLLKECQHYLL